MVKALAAGSLAAAGRRLQRAGRLPRQLSLPPALVGSRIGPLLASADAEPALVEALARLDPEHTDGGTLAEPRRPRPWQPDRPFQASQDSGTWTAGPRVAAPADARRPQPGAAPQSAWLPLPAQAWRRPVAALNVPAASTRPAAAQQGPIGSASAGPASPEFAPPDSASPKPPSSGPGRGGLGAPAGGVHVARDHDLAGLLDQLTGRHSARRQPPGAAAGTPAPGRDALTGGPGPQPQPSRAPVQADPAAGFAVPLPSRSPYADAAPSPSPQEPWSTSDAPVGLAGLVSWWQDQGRDEATPARTDGSPGGVAAHGPIRRSGGDGEPGSVPPGLPGRGWDQWATSAPQFADPSDVQRPAVDQAWSAPSPEMLREALEQLLLDEALADGVEVRGGPA